MRNILVKRKSRGFTLIETMVFLFIFVVTTLAFYRTIIAGTMAIIDAKNRLGAVALVNERLETIRNLAYDKIGTIDGIPEGDIPQDEIMERSGRTYYVCINVNEIDDPQDGTAHDNPEHVHADGDDLRPGDYKQVRVRASWEPWKTGQPCVFKNSSKSVFLNSTFAPPGIESIYAGGILSIDIIDGKGKPVSGATVEIDSSNPSVHATQETDENGNIYYPQAPPADQTYVISVSKNGYYYPEGASPQVITTYARTSSFEPVDINASVVEGAYNHKSITIDKNSAINLYTKDPLGVAIPNVTFDLKGGRIKGYTVPPLTDPPTNPEAIYYYSATSLSSGSSSLKELSDKSSGAYFFTNQSSGYELFHVFFVVDEKEKMTEIKNKFEAAPDSNVATAVLMDKNVDSLLVTVVDKDDITPLVGATVQLQRTEVPAYNVTLTTDKFGQAYFPDASAVLANSRTYNLTISATGYKNANKEVNIDKLTKENIELEKN